MTVEAALRDLVLEDDTVVVDIKDLSFDDLLDFARYGEVENLAAVMADEHGSALACRTQDDHQSSLLHMAAANGHVEVVKLLLKQIDILKKGLNLQNAEGNTALHWAALNGHAEVVRVLIECGAKADLLNAAQKTAWDEAIAREHLDVTSVILGFLEKTHGQPEEELDCTHQEEETHE
jgi:hypothetical protein